MAAASSKVGALKSVMRGLRSDVDTVVDTARSNGSLAICLSGKEAIFTLDWLMTRYNKKLAVQYKVVGLMNEIVVSRCGRDLDVVPKFDLQSCM